MPRASGMPDPQLEMTPLIDVVFLLLTFFVFAMVLASRVEISGVALPEGQGGEAADEVAYVVVALRQDGTLAVDGEDTTVEDLAGAVEARLAEEPDATIVLAPDADARTQDLLFLMDRLAQSGLKDIRFLREPAGGSPAEEE